MADARDHEAFLTDVIIEERQRLLEARKSMISTMTADSTSESASLLVEQNRKIAQVRRALAVSGQLLLCLKRALILIAPWCRGEGSPYAAAPE